MQVFIVNGNPRAGKDTFVELVGKHLAERNAPCLSFSSIDPVRAALTVLGIDVSAKTEMDRALLAELGFSLEKHSLFRSRACVRFCIENPEPVKFLFIREPGVMRVVEAMLGEQPELVEVTKVFVSRPDAPALFSNAADAGVRGIRYDVEISNDAGLKELDLAASRFASAAVMGDFGRLGRAVQIAASSYYSMARAA